VVTPFQPGGAEWSGVSNGIHLRLVLSTSSPRAGAPVTFVAQASMADGLCCNVILEFSDGGEGAYPPGPGVGGGKPLFRREPKSGSVGGELRHVYNKAGRWNFSLGTRSGGVCAPTGAVYGRLEGTLEIGGGSSPSPQGPAQPEVRPASIAPYERYVMTLSAEARDDDGHIDRLIVLGRRQCDGDVHQPPAVPDHGERVARRQLHDPAVVDGRRRSDPPLP